MTDVLIRSGNLDIEKKVRDVQAQKGRTLEDTGRQPRAHQGERPQETKHSHPDLGLPASRTVGK